MEAEGAIETQDESRAEEGWRLNFIEFIDNFSLIFGDIFLAESSLDQSLLLRRQQDIDVYLGLIDGGASDNNRWQANDLIEGKGRLNRNFEN